MSKTLQHSIQVLIAWYNNNEKEKREGARKPINKSKHQKWALNEGSVFPGSRRTKEGREKDHHENEGRDISPLNLHRESDKHMVE